MVHTRLGCLNIRAPQQRSDWVHWGFYLAFVGLLLDGKGESEDGGKTGIEQGKG